MPTPMDDGSAMAALPAPHTDVDTLPYVDTQYNDPELKARVDAMIQAELKTFKPKEYLAHLPEMHEPNFDDHPLLQAEWMRVCEEQPMSKMDTTRWAAPPLLRAPARPRASRARVPAVRPRYNLEGPPPARQTDLKAWGRAVGNAQAQLEHQDNRVVNLELLQKHGANTWRAHLQALEAIATRYAAEKDELGVQIDALNRKRKLEQTEVGPKLQRLEAEWVAAVKKNATIEAACEQLEGDCAILRQHLDPTSQ